MVVAGCGSFYAALHWGPSREPENSGVELRKQSANVVSTSYNGAGSPPLTANATRLEAGILQNPFGPLNPTVTVESLRTPIPAPARETKTASKSKLPAPPVPMTTPAVQTLPPPVVIPTAPPLPFRVLGSIQGERIAGGAPVVFLGDRNGTLVVQTGDQIGNTYQVERITSDRIDFTYLPLKTAQSLSISH